MDEKPKPLLADRFLATTPTHDFLVSRKVADRVRARLRAARVFSLDGAAVDRFADVVRELPELVVRQHEFARAPFDTCWFEFDYRRFWERVTGRTADADSDSLLGYLVDHGTVHAVAGGTLAEPNATPRIVPVSYHLHEPWSAAEQSEFLAKTRTDGFQLDAFLWGESVLHLDRATRTAMREGNSCQLLTPPRIPAHDAFMSFIQGASGDMRNVVALLLLMNRPSLTSFVREIASTRHFLKGKSRPFLSHTVVTIPVDPKPVLLRMGMPDDAETPRRRHEVRGHFSRDLAYRQGTAARCDHAMEPDLASRHPDRSHMCRKCGGKRWWVPAHERGDAGIGFVNKRYLVTG